MAFLVRYHDPAIGHVTVPLVPRPTEIDYPEKRLFKARTTKDGAMVLQRPMRDSRPRRWVWKGYRDYVPNYAALWTLLEAMEVKARWDAGHADTTVEIWENVSGVGGFARVMGSAGPDLENYTNLIFTRVKFVQVNRVARGGGGPVTYDTSVVEFVIADDSFGSF